MPVVFFTYSLAYLDRANYGFASAAGINRDLGITHGISSLLGALFFLGYFFFQIPGAIYAERRSVKKLVFFSLIAWGCLAAATGVIHNIAFLLVIRFCLGVVEAAVMPAMLIFISNWFTQRERSRANTFLILGNPVTILWMSVLSGYLVSSFGWRPMFIAEGVPAVLWAFCWWFVVHDKPRDAKWLSPAELDAIEEALAREQAAIKPIPNYAQALRSRVVILLSLQYFCWCIGVYGFVLWLPSILKDASSLGMVATGWLSALPYLMATLAMIVVSWWSDRKQARLGFVWPCLVVGMLAFLGSYFVGSQHFWLSYALLVIAGAAMYAPYGPFFAIVPELLPKNVAGGAMALINGTGALGSFVGSYAVGYLNGATGSPAASYAFMAAALLLAVGLTFAVKPESSPSASLPAR
jgi:sugar phosphate permease